MSPEVEFSLILPVYNVEPYLRECLESISKQTFKDFEVICVNDGSTDGSLSLLEDFAQRDTRFKIVSQKNQGQGIARNQGLKFAKGDYVVFVDPDDWLEQNALEELYNCFQQTKCNVINFNYREYNDYSGQYRLINHCRRIKKIFGYNLANTPYYSWKNVKKGCLHRLDLHVWTKAYSKSFLDTINAAFAPTKHGEDHLFSHIVLLNAPKIYYLDKYLYNYRCRNGSAVNSISNNKFCVFQNVELLRDYLIQNHFYEDFKNDFKEYQIAVMAWHYKYISSDRIDEYCAMCRKFLTPKEYKKMLYKVRTRGNSFLESIFSIKNEQEFGLKRKVITIFGIKFMLQPSQKVMKGAQK